MDEPTDPEIGDEIVRSLCAFTRLIESMDMAPQIASAAMAALIAIICAAEESDQREKVEAVIAAIRAQFERRLAAVEAETATIN